MGSGTLRMAQYGTGHGHAGGKLRSMQENPDVEVAGVFEPDAARRAAAGGAFADVHWFETEGQMLGDSSIVAVASEGRNNESLGQTEAIVTAGKHVWYDKPAGDDWAQAQRMFAAAKAGRIHVQMGYMLRYHEVFQQVCEWVRSGFLGQVFSVRAHMSTFLPPAAQQIIADNHEGGILYDLSGHMLDQILWMLGRPEKVTSFLRNDSGQVAGFKDNCLGVFEFDGAIATVDIAALETRPMARRFEVYGTRGSAIITEPFEPGNQIRLCLDEARDGYEEGEQVIEMETRSRQQCYDAELVDFVGVVRDGRAPIRDLDHELLVQETILRCAGELRT
ncbi:MAG: Gfo/Idh/MocA family oxidoreductase [Candidatus Latescibacteria bacterium]|nr:Gfo/Idh/MocA family oxidoreductase [Candidatus Latescibacterota bacterium]MDP7448389.1 Gfo/Idh/MocA family oxidoreductase [Candidatus Latescibacterota bacterium]HJP29604.1 Gfo/Idh/MocA family oxidoreductase [Candidatus Latescibacterota bacterium]